MKPSSLFSIADFSPFLTNSSTWNQPSHRFSYINIGVRSPFQGRDKHNDSFIHIPFTRAKEPQKQCIRVISFNHSPKCVANLLWRTRREDFLELFCLSILILPVRNL